MSPAAMTGWPSACETLVSPAVDKAVSASQAQPGGCRCRCRSPGISRPILELVVGTTCRVHIARHSARAHAVATSHTSRRRTRDVRRGSRPRKGRRRDRVSRSRGSHVGPGPLEVALVTRSFRQRSRQQPDQWSLLVLVGGRRRIVRARCTRSHCPAARRCPRRERFLRSHEARLTQGSHSQIAANTVLHFSVTIWVAETAATQS